MNARTLAALVAATLLPGCGWNAGLAAPPGSVGVHWFDNVSPEPGVEVDLTQELTRAVTDLVDARIESPGEANWVVRGTVEEFRRRRGVRNRKNGLLETGVRIAASASLVDRGSGEELASARASVWAGFAVDTADNDRLARERAVHKVADELVLELFAPVSQVPPQP